MKLQYEKIRPTDGNSFKLLITNEPNPNWVYWHFHPEYEIVYIPHGNGRRHIGKHISRYEDGELVFIGPNIPHLNFGFGITHNFEEYVVQLHEDFMGKDFLNQIELTKIQRLFKLSHQVVLFDNTTKNEVGILIQNMGKLSGLDRFLVLLQVLQKLSNAENIQLLNESENAFDIQPKEQERFQKIYKYVEQNFRHEIDYKAVADLSGLTLAAFCRYFKKMTQMTLTDFVNEFRVNIAQNLLLQGIPITTIGYDVGFNNLSHFNRTFKKITGKTPSEMLAQSMVLR